MVVSTLKLEVVIKELLCNKQCFNTDKCFSSGQGQCLKYDMGISDPNGKKIFSLKQPFGGCCNQHMSNHEWVISEYGTDNEVARLKSFMNISDTNVEVTFPRDMALNMKICRKA